MWQPKNLTKRVANRAGWIAFGAACGLATMFAIALWARDNTEATASQKPTARREQAKATFESVCAACHGLDGHGGERGPDLVTRPEVVRKADAELAKVVRDGKPASGMPPFASYGSAKIADLVGYLRALQGTLQAGGKPLHLPGDPDRGKTLFFGTAKCSGCHMVGGQGGFMGQDLTAYAARIGADQVRAAIVEPNKDLDPRRGLITVVLADSTTLLGVARNQDNFSLQLQTADGAFHLLNKADISKLRYEGRSAMPADYGTRLSAAELDDLVSYLLRVAGSQNGRNARNKWEEGEEEE